MKAHRSYPYATNAVAPAVAYYVEDRSYCVTDAVALAVVAVAVTFFCFAGRIVDHMLDMLSIRQEYTFVLQGVKKPVAQEDQRAHAKEQDSTLRHGLPDQINYSYRKAIRHPVRTGASQPMEVENAFKKNTRRNHLEDHRCLSHERAAGDPLESSAKAAPPPSQTVYLSNHH